MLDHAHFGVLHGNWIYKAATGIRNRLVREYKCEPLPNDRGLHMSGKFEEKDGDPTSVYIETHMYFPGFLIIKYDPQWFFYVAISPVDEDHAYMILRHSQNHLRMPVLGPLLSKLFVLMERDIFFHEDNVVLARQRPRQYGWRMDKYVRTDKPIQMFNNWMRQNRPPNAEW
eukprot:ANDGO_01833.mRNA.1 hypothetical protein